MFFLTWNHFKKDNKKLHEYLGSDGTNIDLNYTFGFFICPDDYTNRDSHFPKIIVNFTRLELFKMKKPEIYDNVEQFFRVVGGFDRLNYQKFKDGARVAYLLAAAYFAYENKLPLASLNQLYREAYHKEILAHHQSYLVKLAELAAKNNQRMNIFSLYSYALKLIKETAPKVILPKECNSLLIFLKADGFNPYGQVLGSGFEEEMQKIFESLETSNEHYLTKLIAQYVGSIGVLIPLDGDQEFRKFADKNAKGISIPDYIFVTSKHIVPIDLKVDLSFAKEKQVDPNNLETLFTICESKIKVMFDGFKINGKRIENK